MAGRIRDEDITLVREKSPIGDVIGEHVQLRNAGGGNLKGLCPFHDEKSASFNVTPARGLFYCFGCGAGGDVIKFVQDVEHLDFSDAVERLATRSGVQLRYVEGGGPSSDRHRGQRQRLLDAHREAAAFYAAQLSTPEAETARTFLRERGFDAVVAARYGCGYAPSGWDALTTHLLAKRFTPQELVLAGLSREGGRGGVIDRFHRRLLWPIRDVGGDVVGFGARRLFDDDRVEAKYLNTPETPLYKKSQLLYGVDLAKKEIARQHRAVIVEGYTDVMACHLAGVTTAVATCGTAFGADHVSVVRRLLMDSDAFTGEVIFTFDGDSAGMRAAERAFGDDQKFMAQTFVAIEPTGLDPCDLRLKSGDTAVLDLVARRIPLVEFVLRNTVERFDLDTSEGRSTALDRAIPLVAQIKDFGLRDEYARRLAGLVGFLGSADEEQRILARVRGLVRAGDKKAATAAAGSASTPAPATTTPADGSSTRTAEPVDETVAAVEREVLKIALQLPAVAGPEFDALEPEAFLVDAHRQVRRAIAADRRDGRGQHRVGLDGGDPGAPRGRTDQARRARARRGAAAVRGDRRRALRDLRPRPDALERDRPAGAHHQGQVAADQPPGPPGRARPALRRAHRPRELSPWAARSRERGVLMALFARRERPPAGALAALAASGGNERVLSWADVDDDGTVVLATPSGVWWPDAESGAPRLLRWEYIDQAVWRDGVLTITEATVVDDLLLVERRPVSVPLVQPAGPAADHPQARGGQHRAHRARHRARRRGAVRRPPAARARRCRLVGPPRIRDARHRAGASSDQGPTGDPARVVVISRWAGRHRAS